MPIVDTIANWQQETGATQKATASELHIDQSYLSRMMKGERKWPEHLDKQAAKLNWRIALQIIEERTNGWVKNRFGDVDPTPTALQLQLSKEMKEASQSLEDIILAKNIDWSKRDEQLEKVQKEIKDVVEVGMVLDGVIQDMRNEAKKGEKK